MQSDVERGGKGKFRGGAGVVRALRILTDAEATILSERRTRGPYGLQGGEQGKPGRNVLISGKKEHQLAGKASVSMQEGDIIRIETPGGGGFFGVDNRKHHPGIIVKKA